MKLARFILLATLLVLGHVANASEQQSPLDNIEHIILIYLENWSFDSLFGHFPGANNLLTEAAKNSLPQVRCYNNFDTLRCV
jgi:phospholipase C